MSINFAKRTRTIRTKRRHGSQLSASVQSARTFCRGPPLSKTRRGTRSVTSRRSERATKPRSEEGAETAHRNEFVRLSSSVILTRESFASGPTTQDEGKSMSERMQEFKKRKELKKRQEAMKKKPFLLVSKTNTIPERLEPVKKMGYKKNSKLPMTHTFYNFLDSPQRRWTAENRR